MGYPKGLPQGCSKLRCRIDRKYVGRPGVGQHEDAQVQKDELNPCRYPSEADLEKVKNCVLKASAAPANAKPRCWARWTGPSNPSTGRSWRRCGSVAGEKNALLKDKSSCGRL